MIRIAGDFLGLRKQFQVKAWIWKLSNNWKNKSFMRIWILVSLKDIGKNFKVILDLSIVQNNLNLKRKVI